MSNDNNTLDARPPPQLLCPRLVPRFPSLTCLHKLRLSSDLLRGFDQDVLPEIRNCTRLYLSDAVGWDSDGKRVGEGGFGGGIARRVVFLVVCDLYQTRVGVLDGRDREVGRSGTGCHC